MQFNRQPVQQEQQQNNCKEEDRGDTPQPTELELEQFTLKDTNYLLDPKTLDLYDFVDNEDAELGQPIGRLRSVSIKSNKYYIDPFYSDIYICRSDGSVGEHIGVFENGRAKIKRK